MLLTRSGALLLITALCIACLGILSIYSSTLQKEGDFWELTYKRQIFWVLLGIIFFMLFSNFNYRRFWDATYFLYAATLILLLLVVALGAVRLGAQRWLKVAWFNIQPSEAAKLAIVVFLARYYSTKPAEALSLSVARMGIVRSILIPLAFVIIPVGMIVDQPDLGSGLIIFFIFLIMLYLSGVRLSYITGFLLMCLAMLPLVWHSLRGYQKDRLLVFLNPNIDPLGAGYTIIQSKIAIGSGGIFGKGWLSGTQSQLRFLPESHTDFIFATFAEEWGLLGAGVLLFLYYLLIKQGLNIAARTSDGFGRLLALGISCMFGIQIFTNVAMNLGLAPVVGVPLYLMSYGGSSVTITFISLGILANIDKKRSVF